MRSDGDSPAGVALAVAAFGFWGLSPLYWKLVGAVPPWLLLAHRIAWAAPCLLVLVLWRRRGPALLRAVRGRRTRRTLIGSAALIAVNWVVFIESVTRGHVVEASLGYYVNPLVNVALGAVFLGERLRPLARFAVAVAAVGVALMTIEVGTVPWRALALAGSFGLYGLLRKTVDADAVVGVSVEVALLLPAALTVAVAVPPPPVPGGIPLLALAGPVTVLPLVLFTAAARRLTLATLGFVQYLAPTLQLLVGVVAFGEPFGSGRLRAFVLIWIALTIYTVDLRRRMREPVTR